MAVAKSNSDAGPFEKWQAADAATPQGCSGVQRSLPHRSHNRYLYAHLKCLLESRPIITSEAWMLRTNIRWAPPSLRINVVWMAHDARKLRCRGAPADRAEIDITMHFEGLASAAAGESRDTDVVARGAYCARDVVETSIASSIGLEAERSCEEAFASMVIGAASRLRELLGASAISTAIHEMVAQRRLSEKKLSGVVAKVDRAGDLVQEPAIGV